MEINIQLQPLKRPLIKPIFLNGKWGIKLTRTRHAVRARLDGHVVQGHVDQIGQCTSVKEEGGSWVFDFKYDPSLKNITIEKGSITINGTSLTVVNSGINTFSVAIIPYTYEHTNFHTFQGTLVNLEFDVVGKYITKMQQLQ